MKNNLNKLTILVNSCDAYSDLWEPFFKLFKKFGGELTSYPIVLNTESKQFSYEGLNISCPNKFNTSIEWGRRLRATLKSIDTEYVLFLMDDFFLQSPVEIKTIYQCIDWLNENKDVDCFNFISIEGAQEESKKFKNFCYMPPAMEYRFNAQSAIWRVNTLYNSILDIENPWEWEVYGNKRNSVIHKNSNLYAIKYPLKSPYNYNFIMYKISTKDKILVHSAVMKGKWDLSCIDQCFKENDINIDYSIRGLYAPSNFQKSSFLKRAFRYIKRHILSNEHKKTKKENDEKQYRLVDSPIEEFKKANGDTYENHKNS